VKHRSLRHALAPLLAAACLAHGPGARGQSSSLYLDEPTVAGEASAPPAARGRVAQDPLAPALSRHSLVAVSLPEPRRFAVHDLVFITVRESSESRFDGTLETEKESTVEGEVTSFPSMSLRDLLDLNLNSRDLGEDRPRVGVEFDREFEGEGELVRSDSMTARLAARVIDIRPNGNLVLEARKFLRTDDDSVTLLLTGTCRPQDVGPDNTLESYELYDLHLVKVTDGEVKKASTKGVLTRFLDLLFNF